ncbi:MAG TPA: hypothetical protein RMH99_21155 [Sandaracinaceae bacterium LLY-WYZ-13_1]|nr:hypothetical protein [Sandaracinaceae bacterium LLY-WYZ-13_1]
MIGRTLAAAASVGALLLVAGPARAQGEPAEAARTVAGQVLIVLASDGDGGIDPALARVPALRRPPFDSYSAMELLSSPRIELTVGEAEELELPNGRRIRIILREVTDEGRFRLRVSINRPGQRDYLPEMGVVASPGDPFFVAGQSYRDGTLVIGIRLGERGGS